MKDERIGGLDPQRWVGRRVWLYRSNGRPVPATLVSVNKHTAMAKPDGCTALMSVSIKWVQPWWSHSPDLVELKNKIESEEAVNENGKEISRLSNADFYKATRYAEDHKGALSKMLLPEIVKTIQTATGVMLTDYNAKSVLEVVQVTPRKPVRAAPLEVLTAAVLGLYAKLGEPLPEELQKAVG